MWRISAIFSICLIMLCGCQAESGTGIENNTQQNNAAQAGDNQNVGTPDEDSSNEDSSSEDSSNEDSSSEDSSSEDSSNEDSSNEDSSNEDSSNEDSSNEDSSSEDSSSESGANYKLTGNVTGHTSDLVLKLVLNNSALEILTINYSDKSSSVYEFSSVVTTGDILGLTISQQPLHEQCEVTSLTSPVQSSSPSYAISCTDICGDDNLCKVWRNTHNELRDSMNTATITDDGTYGNYPLPSPAIEPLVWNKTLAQVAQNYAEQCRWEHNGNRKEDYVALGGENIYIGENIAYHSFSSTTRGAEDYAVDQMNLWWDEHSDWHYQSFKSSTINGAGHFTQMIWANTQEVGCGMAYCEKFNNGPYDAYFGVCNYSPGGNYLNQFPYQTP